MPVRNNGGPKSAQLCNWLKKLDEEASTLPRATSWERYGPFMLARYPQLWPQPIPGNWGEAAAQVFADWESRIVGSEVATVCLDGLDAEQRKQLAALLLQTVVNLQMREADSPSAKRASYLRKEAPARLRKLDRRLQKAWRLVKELDAYARDTGAENIRNRDRHTARQLIGNEYKLAADKALKALNAKNPTDAQEFAEIADEHPTPERVEAFGMVQLYWFFRYGCRLSGHESEVRTARLRNVFWTEHGISPVPYRAEYISGQSKGCEAVHRAVWGFKLDKGYKPGA